MTSTPASLASRRVELLRPDDPGWEEWLGPVPRDIYHTAGYHRYARDSGEGEPYLLVVGDRDRGLAWPYLLRRVSQVPGLEGSEATDISSVYGYPGPVAWGARPGDPFIGAAWSDVADAWRQQGAVTSFTRFHPLLGNALLVAGLKVPGQAGPGSGGVLDGGATVSIDLTAGPAAARSGYSKDLLRETTVRRRAGYVTAHDEEFHELTIFARLYRETMLRAGANEYYFFTEDDFQRLRVALGGRLHLLVTRVGDAVTAAGLFTEFDGIVEWLLVGTHADYRHLSPSKVLVDDAVAWAHARGNRVLHLGGGRGGRADTLLWFKSRFSPRRHPFHTGRWTLDVDTSRELARARLAALDPAASLESGYFPLYRAPVSAEQSSEAPASSEPETMNVWVVGPEDAEALGDLLPRIDQTYFRPHPMTFEEAHRIASLRGRDVYLVGYVGTTAVAYGMLRGWEEGFAVPSLGIGVRRDYERRGYGRIMINALHEVARGRGAPQVRLRVHPENRGASALYRHVGYRETGVERYELLMVIDL